MGSPSLPYLMGTVPHPLRVGNPKLPGPSQLFSNSLNWTWAEGCVEGKQLLSNDLERLVDNL